jgi:hypothetical protein
MHFSLRLTIQKGSQDLPTLNQLGNFWSYMEIDDAKELHLHRDALRSFFTSPSQAVLYFSKIASCFVIGIFRLGPSLVSALNGLPTTCQVGFKLRPGRVIVQR